MLSVDNFPVLSVPCVISEPFEACRFRELIFANTLATLSSACLSGELPLRTACLVPELLPRFRCFDSDGLDRLAGRLVDPLLGGVFDFESSFSAQNCLPEDEGRRVWRSTDALLEDGIDVRGASSG